MRNTAQAAFGLKLRLAAAARRFAADRSGATAVEYGMMILIAIAVMLVISEIGGSVGGMFEKLKGFVGS
ncbi:MAG: Flp family type IVb pilin [Methyloceanibacter sp.]|nr:Flp family type IVb pilin [Methyloceanibacter sp.]